MSNRSESHGDSHITIPPEALEAAVRGIAGLRPNPYATNEDVARAACLAMLKAWPGMGIEVARDESEAIILPLTENTNDKA